MKKLLNNGLTTADEFEKIITKNGRAFQPFFKDNTIKDLIYRGFRVMYMIPKKETERL